MSKKCDHNSMDQDGICVARFAKYRHKEIDNSEYVLSAEADNPFLATLLAARAALGD